MQKAMPCKALCKRHKDFIARERRGAGAFRGPGEVTETRTEFCSNSLKGRNHLGNRRR